MFVYVIDCMFTLTFFLNTDIDAVFLAFSEGLDGGGGVVSNSLISKNLAHYSLSIKFLLIL